MESVTRVGDEAARYVWRSQMRLKKVVVPLESRVNRCKLGFHATTLLQIYSTRLITYCLYLLFSIVYASSQCMRNCIAVFLFQNKIKDLEEKLEDEQRHHHAMQHKAVKVYGLFSFIPVLNYEKL